MGLFLLRAELCLVYDQVIIHRLSLHLHHSVLALHMQPLRHNENTQVVPGGETVEGECVKSSQGHVYLVFAFV